MSLRTELRQQARSLRRAPAFRVPAAVSLALGAGVGGTLLAFSWSGLRRADRPASPSAVESGWSEHARSAAQTATEGLESLLRVTEAAGILVVAVLVVNLSLLVLARAASRRRELALRVAIGTPPRRLALHLWADAVSLVAVPVAAGLGGGGLALVWLRGTWPDALPTWLGGSWLAVGMLAASVVPVSAVTLASLAPARRLARSDHRGALQAELRTGSHATPGPHEGIFRQWLGTFTVAVSVALLIGAGTLLLAFFGPAGGHRHLTGIDPHDTLTFHLDLSGAESWIAEEPHTLQHALLQRLTTIPGVAAASISSPGAWLGQGTEERIRAYCGFCVRGTQLLPITQGPARHHLVSPSFFQAHGITILDGREFAASDGPAQPAVAVIDRRFANIYFPGADPKGKEVQIGGRSGERYMVVGVAENVATPALGQGSEPVPTIYGSSLQHAPAAVAVAVRGDAPPGELDALLTTAVQEVDPALTPSDVRPLADRLEQAAAPLRWFGGILAVAGVAALILAALGIFGTLAHEFSRRIREYGVRRALGARPRDLARVVLRGASRIVLPGLWLGLLAGIGIGRFLQVLFLGVRPVEPLVIGGVAAVVLLATLVAAGLPIRLAARVEPLAMIRRE